MGNVSIATILTTFVALVMAIVLISVIATQSAVNTQVALAADTVSIAPARLAGGHINNTYYFALTQGKPASTWKGSTSECLLVDSGVKNQSGGTLTATTDYVLVTNWDGTTAAPNAGDIHFEDTDVINQSKGNSTTVAYTYCPNTYLTQSWSRSTVNIAVGLLALLALGIAIGGGWSIYKDLS